MPRKLSKANVEGLLEDYKKLKRERKIDFYRPYPWQLEFLNASGHNHGGNTQIASICANRVGKTITGAVAITFHLTGEYPDWYEGKRFRKPVKACVLGISGDQMRDVLQQELIGDCDLVAKKFVGNGMIPPENIEPHGFMPSTGVRGLLKEIKIKHKTGGLSKLIFRSSEQGRQVLQGMSLDAILIDEESPYKGLEIYGEAISRTATGDNGKGGITYLSFTPERGMSPLVDLLLNQKVEGQLVIQVGWDEAPHLDEKTKKQLISAIPEYMRPAKTRGEVTFGDSAVWPVTEEEIACEPFPIPDYFKRICGIDFGISHFFSASFAAYDADRDIIYIYDCFKVKNQVATQHAHVIRQKGGDIRVTYPHDGNRRNQGDGKQLVQFYKDAGLNIFRRFENKDGSISIEVGIFEMVTRMKEGRFKVFRTLSDFWEEFRKYHRDKNGQIVAKNDDCMDSTRYAALMVQRFGMPLDHTEQVLEQYYPDLNY